VRLLLSVTQVFRALILWLRAQPAAARDESSVSSLLGRIRFACLSDAFLSDVVETEPLMDTRSALRVLAQAMKEKGFGARTPRTAPRCGVSLSPQWVLDGYPASRASAEPDGKLVMKNNGVVRLDTLISSARYEVVFKLLADAGYTSCFGLIRHDITSPSFERDDIRTGKDGFWFLRRYTCAVRSEHKLEGGSGEVNFPPGAEVRMLVDMDAGEATFFVNDVELEFKAKNFTSPVYPFVMNYTAKSVTVEVRVVRMRRVA
jgi:hypothetical protein